MRCVFLCDEKTSTRCLTSVYLYFSEWQKNVRAYFCHKQAVYIVLCLKTNKKFEYHWGNPCDKTKASRTFWKKHFSRVFMTLSLSYGIQQNIWHFPNYLSIQFIHRHGWIYFFSTFHSSLFNYNYCVFWHLLILSAELLIISIWWHYFCWFRFIFTSNSSQIKFTFIFNKINFFKKIK